MANAQALPSTGIVDFDLEPPKEPSAPAADSEDDCGKQQPTSVCGTTTTAEGTVIVCIDVSGSMDTTIQVAALQAEWNKLRSGQAPTYVSRLDCIKVWWFEPEAKGSRKVSHLGSFSPPPPASRGPPS